MSKTKGVRVKHKLQAWINVGVVAVLVGLMSGCGANLFSSFVSLSEDDTLEEINSILDDAKTTEDYVNAKAKADEILASDTVSTANKQEANQVKGEAILGEADITLTDILQDFNEISNAETLDEDSFFEILPTADNQTLIDAAQAFNNADELSGETGVTPDADVQLNRGIANSMVAVNLVKDVFVFEDDGGVETGSDKSVTESIAALADPDTGLSVFVSEASDAFEKADALSEEQNDQVQDITTASEELTELQAGIDSEGSYELSDGSTVSLDPDDPNYEDNLDAAVDDIFQNISGLGGS